MTQAGGGGGGAMLKVAPGVNLDSSGVLSVGIQTQ